MSGKVARVDAYLDHILEAIDRIEQYVADLDEPHFLENQLVQDAVIRNLEIIGEASRNIVRADPSFVETHPKIPLAPAYEMRNALSHGYFKIDMAIV